MGLERKRVEVVFQDFHSFVQPEFHVFSTNSLVNALKIKVLVFKKILFKFQSLRYSEFRHLGFGGILFAPAMVANVH